MKTKKKDNNNNTVLIERAYHPKMIYFFVNKNQSFQTIINNYLCRHLSDLIRQYCVWHRIRFALHKRVKQQRIACHKKSEDFLTNLRVKVVQIRVQKFVALIHNIDISNRCNYQ